MASLPVVWVSEEKRGVGKLDVLRDRICLDGSCEGIDRSQELRRSEIRRVRQATVSERLWGNPTLVIEPLSGPLIRLMPMLCGAAMIGELIQQLGG